MRANTKALRTALHACAPAISVRTLPILGCVRLEANGSLLTLLATDLNIFIERRVECDGILPSCCVGHKLLQQVLDQIQGEQVELAFSGPKLTVSDTVGNAVSRLSVMDGDAFPVWPLHPVKPIAVNSLDLAAGLQTVEWACATPDRQRPILENAFIKLSAKEIICVGMEGRMMAHFSRASICGDYTCRLPAEFIPPIVAALNEPHSLLHAGESNLTVDHEHGRTSAKLSELAYSNEWPKFLEQKNGHPSLSIKNEILKRACTNCVNLHDDKMGPQLNIDWQKDGKLILETAGKLNGERREIENPNISGSGTASLNATFLADALKQLGEDVIFTPVPSASFWQSGDVTVIISQLRRA